MSNRDLKQVRSAGRKPAAGKSGGGMMTGVLVGLIVGVGVAIGVAFYMNKASVPYPNLEKMQASRPAASEPPAELLAPGARLSKAEPAPIVVPPKAVASQPVASSKPQDDEQRFDFYKILPGQLEAVPSDPAGTDSKAQRPSDIPVKVYLQAGAFNNESDADNMKARLALMGVEATISSTSVPEKGLIHRVRIGPFDRTTDVEPLRKRLRQDGIDVAVVRLPSKQ